MLQENPDKIVVLDEKAQNRVTAMILKQKNPELSGRYFSCCRESVGRMKEHQPQSKNEIYEMVEEAKNDIIQEQDLIDEESAEHQVVSSFRQ